MLHGEKVLVVLPAYNAGITLKRTFEELPRDIVDEVILKTTRVLMPRFGSHKIWG